MALVIDRIAVITDNLTDAGFDENGVEECLKMLDKNEIPALKKYLINYRKQLLDSVHKFNKRIDCLDYFTYTLKKSMEVK